MSHYELTVVTSSWAAPLPAEYARIGISRGPPRRQSGYRMYRALAPGPWFSTAGEREYCDRYMAMLRALDPRTVLADLKKLSGELVPALLCFEPPPPNPDWCHRGLVSAWFGDTIGLVVNELGHEMAGAGWTHPKLPPSIRRLFTGEKAQQLYRSNNNGFDKCSDHPRKFVTRQ